MLDLNNIPRNEDGSLDYDSKEFQLALIEANWYDC